MDTVLPKLTFERIRLDYIDALRGLAALMVVVCHSLQVDPSLPLGETEHRILESFKYGVQLFFVISAFTIFYSLYSSDTSSYNFFIRRFFRIAPLYFVAIVTYSLLYGTDIKGMALNFFFLHGFTPKYINSIVPGGWSIGVEMMFYCLVPLIFRSVTTIKRSLYFFLGAVVLSFSLFYIYRKLVPSSPNAESYMYFWLPSQMPAFAIGVIVFFLSFRPMKNTAQNVFFPLCFLALLIMAVLITDLRVFGEHIIFAAAAGLFIFLLKFKSFPRLVNGTTLLLGKVSYSLYLCQYAAIFILQKTGIYTLVNSKMPGTVYLNILINFLLLFLVTFALSYVLYHVVEQPFQILGKKLLKKKVAFTETVPDLPAGEVRTVFTQEEVKI
ncbi:MAG: acyltransferase [Chitinophagaceae bacterium]|nr:MAG: acyltransferase [Chitinophagaceae bacterium]